jgi:hypothetical protein
MGCVIDALIEGKLRGLAVKKGSVGVDLDQGIARKAHQTLMPFFLVYVLFLFRIKVIRDAGISGASLAQSSPPQNCFYKR